jgi:membrane fusion protein, copper/silver efflux system
MRMNGTDALSTSGVAGGQGESLPEGEEAPPPGARAMGIVRWSLVAIVALGAAGAWIHYAGETGEGATHAAAAYVCPMHPAVVQDRPGSCPICGMDLVRAAAPGAGGPAGEGGKAAAAAPAAGKYWCPMHPEVTSDHPEATCPKCGGMKLVPRDPKAMAKAAASSSAGAYWCPMHPEIASDDPEATCPKCGGTKLVPRTAGGGKPGARVPGLAPVQISAERTQLIGLRTAKVVRQPLAPRVRAFGYVSANERSVAIVTARASGWVDELKVAQAGQRVGKGDVLLTLYSGEVVAAQQAYLDALRWKRNLAATNPDGLPPAAQVVDRDSLRRLRLLGVANEDVEALAQRNETTSTIPIRAPRGGFVARKSVLPGQYVAAGSELYEIADLSTVWVIADLFEQDMQRVAVGRPARFLPASSPGTSFPGRVDFIYPAVNPETRTLQARMEFRNPEMKLRPGAFGDVVIEAHASDAITVPSEAVVDTGEMQYVFLALPGGRFEARAVRTGTAGEGRTEILDGLAEGEAVVTTANFLLDSESRLRAAAEAHSDGADPARAR